MAGVAGTSAPLDDEVFEAGDRAGDRADDRADDDDDQGAEEPIGLADKLADQLTGKLGWVVAAVFLVGLAVLVFLAAK